MTGRFKRSYVLILCFVFTLAVAKPLIASTGPTTKNWVARYNSETDNCDGAIAIAVDSSGNVYVTGWTYDRGSCYDYVTVDSGPCYDYVTAKYDTAGKQLWVARYNGPGNTYDIALAIDVDVSGNVYVTGGSYGIGTYYDYATVKYDTDGNQLWVKRYNGPGNDRDLATAIAVDVSGNVYITGKSRNNEINWDYATIKYDTDGSQLWVARYSGPGNGADEASAIAVDSSGNVYVSGVSMGSGTDNDYATVKYDPQGNELWVARYNGPGNGADEASAIAVDLSGNVYVTGESYEAETDADYATVKYDPDGNELWIARYNGPADASDIATAIAMDASGNIYVTGMSHGAETDSDYATVKYDPDGNKLWVARYNGPADASDIATAIAVDALGNVYVTGESHGTDTDTDYATVKYGPIDGINLQSGIEKKMELPAGWSMISLPVQPAVSTVTTLFPEAVTVYKYQKGTGYVQVQAGENLEIGIGYWILLDSPQSYLISGTEIAEYNIPVEDGWYMIGGCSMPAQKMVTSGNIDVIYGYTQGIGYERILESEPLERGKGYWILFSSTSEGAEFTASTAVSE